MPEINTSYIYPPIPVRKFDWLAWFDDKPEGPYGYGETEEKAIADLRIQVDEQ